MHRSMKGKVKIFSRHLAIFRDFYTHWQPNYYCVSSECEEEAVSVDSAALAGAIRIVESEPFFSGDKGKSAD